MAARENQGLQIALIIFVMLTIVLIVTTYMFFSNLQIEKEKNKALMADNASKTKTASDAVAETEAIKNMIGAALSEKAEAILAKTKNDVETYGKGIPEANQNYRFLVEHLATELDKARGGIHELTARTHELSEKLKANDAAEKAEIAKYTDNVKKTAEDLESERKKFGQDRQEITTQQSTLSQRFEAKRKEHEELTTKSGEQVASLNDQNSKLTMLLKNINNEKLRGTKANEVSDGKVTWIDQRSRLVWINLGSEDGLHPQTSFSIFASDDTNPQEGKHKGKIEVVRLMNRHLAEARIVDDDFSNPIMPGDLIFSPSWEPGRKEHFALAGFMDIDNDGSSDRQRIRDLIALNGGVIDEEVTDDNKKTGQMTIHTKYLVMGDQPSDEGKFKYYSEINGEAQTLGVPVINVHKFLDYMGYKPEDRTVNLGKTANPKDFKPRFPNDRQRVMPGSTLPKDPRKPAVPKKTS